MESQHGNEAFLSTSSGRACSCQFCNAATPASAPVGERVGGDGGGGGGGEPAPLQTQSEVQWEVVVVRDKRCPPEEEAEVVVVRDKRCPPEEEAEVVRATLRSVQTHAAHEEPGAPGAVASMSRTSAYAPDVAHLLSALANY